MSDWQLSLFNVRCDHDGVHTDRTSAGWVKGFFALDPRIYDEECRGWVITHLPTGFIVRGVKGNLAAAKTIADELQAACDWDFTDAGESKSRALPVKALMDKHPELTTTVDFSSALWLDGDE